MGLGTTRTQYLTNYLSFYFIYIEGYPTVEKIPTTIDTPIG
jgi:hypothetical protein